MRLSPLLLLLLLATAMTCTNASRIRGQNRKLAEKNEKRKLMMGNNGNNNRDDEPCFNIETAAIFGLSDPALMADCGNGNIRTDYVCMPGWTYNAATDECATAADCATGDECFILAPYYHSSCGTLASLGNLNADAVKVPCTGDIET